MIDFAIVGVFGTDAVTIVDFISVKNMIYAVVLRNGNVRPWIFRCKIFGFADTARNDIELRDCFSFSMDNLVKDERVRVRHNEDQT